MWLEPKEQEEVPHEHVSNNGNSLLGGSAGLAHIIINLTATLQGKYYYSPIFHLALETEQTTPKI